MFLEAYSYKELSSKHYSNALIGFLQVFFEAHLTALTIRDGNPLMLNCRLTCDNVTIIFIFMKDKVVFEI